MLHVKELVSMGDTWIEDSNPLLTLSPTFINWEEKPEACEVVADTI